MWYAKAGVQTSIPLGYEPADLSVHTPPHQNCRGWVNFFRIGVQCSPKNILKLGKPVFFGVVPVKIPKTCFFTIFTQNKL